MSAKRELYREGTPENIKKGYTELVYGGENIEVDKGVISGQSGGSGGGVMIVNADWNEDETSLVLDKTWEEITNALSSNIPCYERDLTVDSGASLRPIIATEEEMGTYLVYVAGMANVPYESTSIDGYPEMED